MPTFSKLDSASIEDLGVFSDLVIQKCDSCIAVCGSAFKNKALLTVGVSKKMSKKINAQEIIKILAVLLEGSGGGKPVFAQAGGRKISGLNKIMDTGKEILKKYLEEKLS